MNNFNSNLFKKFEDSKIVKESQILISGGKKSNSLAPVGPGGTTNDCTGTGGDCWDADCGTNVIDDVTWTGGEESGNDTCY
jgi:hypothetical protein